MTKAVFTTKAGSIYDDLPEVRYHFPETYLRQVKAAVGDWIVYYEPRRKGEGQGIGGRSVYFATARVVRIIRDPSRGDHFYAEMADYLEFDRAVPFKEDVFFYESVLRKEDGSTNKGAFGRAVRSIPDREYDLILQAGFARVLGEPVWPRPRSGMAGEEVPASGLEEGQAPFEPEITPRPLLTQILQRPFRDRAFAAAVKQAYGDTCAVTGIKIINGGGRSEVQAAHIRPVADDGPDSVRNGIALSGTVHWMFDRGLLSIDEDYSLLIAQDRVPDTVTRLIAPDRRLILPARHEERPHPHFLKYHRERVYKGG